MNCATSSRYLIGIDLGTTNSVVAYIDTLEQAAPRSGVKVFPVPQLVAHGEVRTLSGLPSFLYFPTKDELSSGAVCATWDEEPPMVTGLLAREQGALAPARQVASAKSWLSYPGVNRRGKILPAQAEAGQPMISPIDASTRYLMHLRDAWNGALGSSPETRLERQEIVLTVPASFDEEARELTVEAARDAGFVKLTLLEEPLAAFYAWIDARESATADEGSHSPTWRDVSGDELRDGELILICDIGGGTSDFSLVRTYRSDGELQFERTAVGEHLLLGGDNLDFALAHRVEQKLGDAKLTLRQRYALRRSCCAAKERLLSDPTLERVPVTVLGSGRAVIGQLLSVELAREEVLEILRDGFLPLTVPDEMPARGGSTGLRELGLPYASDPAITKHLAAFLTQAAVSMNIASERMARPDALLFNGGFCVPEVIRQRIADAIAAWFHDSQSGWRPKLLHNDGADTAVARGAAYYGLVRRGHGTRVKVGSARTYYIGLPSKNGSEGICILPAGVEAGVSLPPLKREFSVLANRPVSFTLYSSRTEHHAQGEVIALDETKLHRHAPLVSLLRYGKKMRERYLEVWLSAGFTEVGTLELWCESRDSSHRWRLQFELRAEESLAEPGPDNLGRMAARTVAASGDAGLELTNVESGERLIREVFSGSAEYDAEPETLVSQIEAAIGVKRNMWPLAMLRRFGDVLIELAERRKRSPRHELRWLNLLGICLRPGFGAPEDERRMNRLGNILAGDLAFASDLQCQIEWLVMLRRVAGGINSSRQQELYRRNSVGAAGKKKRRNRQLDYDTWRMMASLEHLTARERATLGRELLAKIEREPEDAIWLWSLGRLGARIPLYGPLHCVVGPETAGEWLKTLLAMSAFTAATALAIVSVARRTEDSSRDIDAEICEQAISHLVAMGTEVEMANLISKYVAPEQSDAIRSFGEALPPGLQVVSSANCLLSVPALHDSRPTAS